MYYNHCWRAGGDMDISVRQIFLLLTTMRLLAETVDFGRSEVRLALAARGLAESAFPKQISVAPGKPECYQVTSQAITGSDERGLMYGLLEAASQIRAAGRLSNASGCPAVAMRGIRYFLHNHDLEKNWYYSRDYWDRY